MIGVLIYDRSSGKEVYYSQESSCLKITQEELSKFIRLLNNVKKTGSNISFVDEIKSFVIDNKHFHIHDFGNLAGIICVSRAVDYEKTKELIEDIIKTRNYSLSLKGKGVDFKKLTDDFLKTYSIN